MLDSLVLMDFSYKNLISEAMGICEMIVANGFDLITLLRGSVLFNESNLMEGYLKD